MERHALRGLRVFAERARRHTRVPADVYTRFTVLKRNLG